MADKKTKAKKPVVKAVNPNGSYDVVVKPKPTPKPPVPPVSKSTFTKEVAIKICAEIAEGKSLRSIVGRDDMPAMSTVFLWLSDNEWFSEQYARAKLESADAHADDINDIAKRTLEGTYDPASARVAVDALKWTASKLKPKKYGDKLELENNVKHSLTDKSEEELNQLVQDYLKGINEKTT